MYFDARLWRLTRGLRAGMAGGILLACWRWRPALPAMSSWA